MNNYRLQYHGESHLEIVLDSQSPEFFYLLKDRISSETIRGIEEIITYPSSVLLRIDPLSFDQVSLHEKLIEINIDQVKYYGVKANISKIPICFHDDFVLDKSLLEEKLKMSFHEIIDLHIKSEFFLEMYGFIPGFIYLKGLTEKLRLPRKKEPEIRIPAGSVAIANNYCGIYPAESPGGWYVIGRTPISIFHPDREPSFLLVPGQNIRFYQISRDKFESWDR